MILRGSCRVLSLAARVNEPAKFLAQVDFLTPMFFRISAAAELAVFVRTNTALDSFAVPVLSLRSTGIPSMLKLHWLKSTFAAKFIRFIHSIYALFSG